MQQQPVPVDNGLMGPGTFRVMLPGPHRDAARALSQRARTSTEAELLRIGSAIYWRPLETDPRVYLAGRLCIGLAPARSLKTGEVSRIVRDSKVVDATRLRAPHIGFDQRVGPQDLAASAVEMLNGPAALTPDHRALQSAWEIMQLATHLLRVAERAADLDGRFSGLEEGLITPEEVGRSEAPEPVGENAASAADIQKRAAQEMVGGRKDLSVRRLWEAYQKTDHQPPLVAPVVFWELGQTAATLVADEITQQRPGETTINLDALHAKNLGAIRGTRDLLRRVFPNEKGEEKGQALPAEQP
jgi:hypothetical protein